MKISWLYRFLRPIFTFLMKLLFRPIYIGLENIPKEGRVVLAGNHTGYLDCGFLISSTKRTVHFLAKKQLLDGPKKIFFGNMGIIPVDRSIHDKNALGAAIDALKNEEIIGIFPEGTINRTDDVIMPFKIGVVKMAYEADCEVVPFVITGKYRLFQKERPTIEFYKPIKPKHKDLDIDNKKLMKVVSDGLIEKRK